MQVSPPPRVRVLLVPKRKTFKAVVGRSTNFFGGVGFWAGGRIARKLSQSNDARRFPRARGRPTSRPDLAPELEAPPLNLRRVPGDVAVEQSEEDS